MQRAVVVDGSREIGELTRLNLELGGVQVVGASCDVIEALRLIERLDPDVVVVDIQTPGMSGAEVVEVMRQGRPLLRVVAYAADRAGLVEALHAGADAAVLKSGSRDELLLELDS